MQTIYVVTVECAFVRVSVRSEVLQWRASMNRSISLRMVPYEIQVILMCNGLRTGRTEIRESVGWWHLLRIWTSALILFWLVA